MCERLEYIFLKTGVKKKFKKSTHFPLRCAQHLRAACPARKRQTFGDVCNNADHLSKRMGGSVRGCRRREREVELTSVEFA